MLFTYRKCVRISKSLSTRNRKNNQKRDSRFTNYSKPRVRDKSEEEIWEFVENCIILVFRNSSFDGRPFTNRKSRFRTDSKFDCKKIKRKNIDSKIDLYLSVSNKPNFSKLGKKTGAKPNGFMTQVFKM